MSHFVVADASGRILSNGTTPEKHIVAKRAAGERVIVTETLVPLHGFRVNEHDEIEPCSASAGEAERWELRTAILSELARSDHTQLADAAEHIPAEEIAAWRAYRKALRSALKAASASDMRAALPASSPDKHSQFSKG